MSNLFQYGAFKSHAGLQLKWKIECEALSDEDWRSVAIMVATHLRYKRAVGIPTGGDKFAKFLNMFCDETSNVTLIVDDVLTTGASMSDALDKLPRDGTQAIGVVLFSRMSRFEVPHWIRPIFQLEFVK